jgi:3-deoxy-D-manno-octulosonic-acid transferase
MGPHTFNFAEAAELAISAGAALRVPSLFQALVTVQEMINDPPALAGMAAAADEFSKAHRGAVEKTLAAVLAVLGQQEVDAL